ncbi:UNVERIFIED_CONTAM: hypothetical protein GTU68_040524, partial [Idotea baltica]|nr:hypothetical protein [Idotea baltica]
MLKRLGLDSLEQLVAKTIPDSIRLGRTLKLAPAMSEVQSLNKLQQLASENQIYRSYIGMGYSDCITPSVIQRNILENPGWYTAYTPYQPEIAQGRLEAIFNFQTIVSELSGLPVANSSLLDEGTAAAEAMTLMSRILNRRSNERMRFYIGSDVHPQTIAVVQSRALPLGIEAEVVDLSATDFADDTLGALIQYPASDGEVVEHADTASRVHAAGGRVCVAADLLSLMMLPSPGSWDADIVVGNSQRFGVPLGFGGPHAAFFATKEEFKREVPGRIVGLSKDDAGKPAFRLALQTREQHIRREKATSNICTAQVLLAVMAGMYAVYHGPVGLRRIANGVHRKTVGLVNALESCGVSVKTKNYFDTVRTVPMAKEETAINERLSELKINLRSFEDSSYGISLNEVCDLGDVADVVYALSGERIEPSSLDSFSSKESPLAVCRERESLLQAEVFNSYQSETEMLRYMARLESRDLSLKHSMIPLGSCTMKLNASSEMAAVTWPGFSKLHPFAPEEQTQGYIKLFDELEGMLSEITGFPKISLQPNAGSQGEYAGLLAIRNCLRAKGQTKRDVCLIPQSAHGTNPASAVMAGFKVVIVRNAENGDIDIQDLKKKLGEYKDTVGALMITYPSTHGVFEHGVNEICDLVHQAGAFVYMDGANLNAQVGLCRPADFGMDVCHLNLHKTFCIPHGGGGPGVGPIGLTDELAPFAPAHPLRAEKHAVAGPVSAAPYAYIQQMGPNGLTRATELAILNANYIAKRLEDHYPILYKGRDGFVAHECILDLRSFRAKYGVQVVDVSKRLMDYNYHAPTVSWPVAETLMVEPTESESLAELDRFCDAMIAIKLEIEASAGKEAKDNPLLGAPHTADAIASSDWPHSYSREQAVFPLEWVREAKFW